MKNTNIKIILAFAAFFVVTGLMAQSPEPVHTKGTDKEVQQEERSTDRTYKRTRSGESRNSSRTRPNNQPQTERTNSNSGERTSGSCGPRWNSRENDRNGATKTQRKRARPRIKLNKEAFKTAMRKRQVQVKNKGKRTHPVFNKRVTVRRGTCN